MTVKSEIHLDNIKILNSKVPMCRKSRYEIDHLVENNVSPHYAVPHSLSVDMIVEIERPRTSGGNL